MLWRIEKEMRVSNSKVRDLDKAWWRCLRETLLYGDEYTIDRGSYKGQKRKELDFIIWANEVARL